MNPSQHNDEQLESALRSLPLRKPSEMLDHRVGRAMTRRTQPWRGYAAAACFGGLCFWFGLTMGQGTQPIPAITPADPDSVNQESAPTGSEGGYRLALGTQRIDTQWPIAESRHVYDIDDGPPISATIHHLIERTHWVDADNNLDIELTRPVREVKLARQDPY